METPEDSNKGPIDRISSVNEHLSVEIRPEDETALVLFLPRNIVDVLNS